MLFALLVDAALQLPGKKSTLLLVAEISLIHPVIASINVLLSTIKFLELLAVTRAMIELHDCALLSLCSPRYLSKMFTSRRKFNFGFGGRRLYNPPI